MLRKWPMLGTLVLTSVASLLAIVLLFMVTPLSVTDLLPAQPAAIDPAAAQTGPIDGAALDPTTGAPLGDAQPVEQEPAGPSVVKALVTILLMGAVFMGIMGLGAIAAVRAAALPDEGFVNHFKVLPQWLRQQSQCGIVALPLLLVLGMAVINAANGNIAVAALLGFLAFPVNLALAPVMLLALVGTALGDDEWLPRRPIELVRANLRYVLLTMLAVGGISIGVGIVAAVLNIVPLLGQLAAFALQIGVQLFAIATAVVMYRAIAGDAEPIDTFAPQTHTEPAAGADAPVPAPAVAGAAGAASTPAAAPMAAAPQPVASSTGVLVPAQPHGEWINLPAAGTAAVQLAWSEGPAPQLALANATGEWLPVSCPEQNGGAVHVALPAGHVWVHLQASGAESQSWRLTVWPPAQSAAA
jgi:hypothetical protein